MANDYFNHSTTATRHTRGRAEAIDSLAESIEDGFDLLPSLSALQHGTGLYLVDTGAADAYVVTFGVAPTYTAGLTVLMRAANANTGASTVNVNALGVKAIHRYDGSALSANDILAGHIVHLVYDATSGYFRIVGMHGSDKAAAAASAVAAAASASSASTSASTATTQASTATTQAGLANTARVAAELAETNAETAATAAQLAETNAETAETNAETAETNAETAQAAAEVAQAAAEAAAATAELGPFIGFKIGTSGGVSFSSPTTAQFDVELLDTDDFYDNGAHDGNIDIPVAFDGFYMGFMLRGAIIASVAGTVRLLISYGGGSNDIALAEFTVLAGTNNVTISLGEHEVLTANTYTLRLQKLTGGGTTSFDAGGYLQGRLVSGPPA